MTATPTHPPYSCFVGVASAAASFTACWSVAGNTPTKAATFAQSPSGFAALQQQLGACAAAPAQTLIAMEATGSYWITLAVTLHQAGYQRAVVNPAQLHSYAQSLPRRGKTAALDAQLLLRCAAERQPTPWTPPPRVYHELRQRLVVRAGLMNMAQQARNQWHALAQWPVQVGAAQQQLEGVIADLEARRASLEREIAAVLRDGEWAIAAGLLQTSPGISLVTTAWLLVGTLNFSLSSTPEQAAAYVGLVPLPHESGTSVRGRARLGHSGNGRLRRALYMASLAATRYNPAIKLFYERLRSAGKPPKLARCAAARKLLHQAWAVVTKQQPFENRIIEPKPLLLEPTEQAA